MFKLYNASAGSGKTTHLVIEYLLLCFKNVQNYKRVLAITFTNNATAEMKSRIIETLNAFSFQQYEQLSASQQVIYTKIKKIGNFSDDKMQEKATALLQHILYDYADFSISTIDSFFQRIIRAFSLDLGLNLNYNVEIQLDDFYEQTIDLLLNRISADNHSLTNRVMEIVNKKMDESGKWGVKWDLLNFMPIIYDEKSFEAMKALEQIPPERFAEIRKKLLAQLYKIKEELVELAQRGDEKIRSTNLDASQFYRGTQGIFNCFSTFLKSFSLPWNSYIKEAIEDRERITKDATLISEALNKDIIAIYNDIRELFPSYKKLESYTKNITSLMIMVDLKEIMNEIKERDNLFYLQEANFKIHDNIKDEETPYIFEKLGNKYGYFFIDEFQDTSKMQWENLLPLLKNALSQSYSAQNEPGDVILFGDMKQAIYRFRNGDSSLFHHLSKKEGYIETISPNDKEGKYYQTESLDTNYRSAKSIITFNNLFFDYLKRSENENVTQKNALINDYYAEVEQKIPLHNQDKEGFVSIQFAQQESDLAIGDYMQQETKNAIEDALSRGYQYADIAILSANNQMGSAMGQFLNNEKIPVISSDSLLLNSSYKVNVLVAFLQFILNQEDEIAKLFLFQYFNQDKKLNLTDIKNKLATSTFIAFLQDKKIDADWNNLRKIPLYTLTKELCKLLSFSEIDAYISSFLENVLQYESKKGKALVQFLDWWKREQNRLSLSSAGKINAITISTIHKAKGLEYPIVIFPITQYKAGNSNTQIWHKCTEEDEEHLPYYLVPLSDKNNDKELVAYYETENALSELDRMNLLYVVHTRPTDGMYIITKNQEKGNYSKKLAVFIKQHESKFVYEEESNRYWLGNREYKNEKKEKFTQQSPDISKFNFSNFSPLDSLFISDLEKSKEQEVGIMIHDFLSKLDTFPHNEQEIDNLSYAHYSEEEILFIKNALQKIIDDDYLKPYFSDEVRVLKEVTIATAGGELRRPDRVVFLPQGEVVVIDYKTGEKREAYQQQIDDYCNLLKEMGYQKVSGHIIYL